MSSKIENLPGQDFQLQSSYEPKGDQPQAIEELLEGLKSGQKHQTLLGVTGSGKTFTIANVVAQYGRPTLVISHNKTLAAQLYGELKAFFPNNAVEFFISYYDYYQPEAYVPSTDTYIEKDTSVNEDIDRLRLRATASLLERRDVIIVASVSCIYGLGSPEEYRRQLIIMEEGMEWDRDEVIRRLIDIHYIRNEVDFSRGRFRVRGDTIELIPAYYENAIRIEFFGDEVERLTEINPLTGEIIAEKKRIAIYPAKHFITSRDQLKVAIKAIQQELAEQLHHLRTENLLLEAQRLESRTNYDLEMLKEVGYCTGVENYSRHLTGRKEGERPFTLIDFFGDEFLVIIDESHQTIPQIGAMYAGDRNRKQTLVSHGFRLPSALDNRPLYFEEFEGLAQKCIYVSATPADYELEKSQGVVVEQVIRPTGLLDPVITVKPLATQVDDLLEQVRIRKKRDERVLVTTLTKRMAEDLTEYMTQHGVKVRYLHSEVASIDRTELIRDLRLAAYDVLVGVNLLREGLDLPEVSLVAILDADKEGFLRSETSLVQTIGRCARNVNATVYLYGDKVTGSMRRAIDETNRRRAIQLAYNEEHGITPDTIRKAIRQGLLTEVSAMRRVREAVHAEEGDYDRDELIAELEKEMLQAAEELDFEKAAALRDHVKELKESPELKVASADARPKLVKGRRDAGDWKPKGQHRRPKKRRR